MVALSKGQNFTLHTSPTFLTTYLTIASEVPSGGTSMVLKCIGFKRIISYGHMSGVYNEIGQI